MILSESGIEKQKEYIRDALQKGEYLEVIVKWIVEYAYKDDKVELLMFTFSDYQRLE